MTLGGLALTAVAVAVATAYVLPRAGLAISKYTLSGAGKFFLTWGGVAVLYDLFMTGDRPFNTMDAGVTGALALLVRVVV